MTQETVHHKPLVCLCSQEAAWYLRRHKQELELLLIGSKTMGVEFTEGVSQHNTTSCPFLMCSYKLKADCEYLSTVQCPLILSFAQK